MYFSTPDTLLSLQFHPSVSCQLGSAEISLRISVQHPSSISIVASSRSHANSGPKVPYCSCLLVGQHFDRVSCLGRALTAARSGLGNRSDAAEREKEEKGDRTRPGIGGGEGLEGRPKEGGKRLRGGEREGKTTRQLAKTEGGGRGKAKEVVTRQVRRGTLARCE